MREAGLGPGVSGVHRFETGGEGRIAGWRSVFLRSSFGVPDWYVVVSETEGATYAPVASFAYNLPLALAVAFGLVLLLANRLVARTMKPLVQLTDGTRAIARHDLTAAKGIRKKVATHRWYSFLKMQGRVASRMLISVKPKSR